MRWRELARRRQIDLAPLSHRYLFLPHIMADGREQLQSKVYRVVCRVLNNQKR